MSSREVENVCNYLRSKGIQLSSNNLWLGNCISWYNSHLELRNVFGTLQEYVCIQWLLADLQDVQHSCLPTNYKERVLQLAGKYSVQINWMRDIGKSCYSQLQSVQSVDESESYFSEDEPKKANWEPKLKRVLMMEITDGVNTLKAMEYSPIPKLTEPFIPGAKVVLSGPIECRNGILLLKNDNVTLLGGEVEQLYKNNALETLLTRCLGLTDENETTQTEVDNRSVPNLTASVPNLTASVPNRTAILPNQTASVPSRPMPSVVEDSPVATNVNIVADDRSNFMMDEGDEFLCDVPDEILNSQESINEVVFNRSPVLEVRTLDSNRQSASGNGNVPSVHSRPQERNRPKLFPSLEDLRPVGRPQTSLNEAPSSSLTPLMNSTAVEADNSFRSANSLTSPVNHSVRNNFMNSKSSESLSKGHSNTNVDDTVLNMCDDDSMDCMINNDVFPKQIKVQVKVDSIIKLKIRNSEWLCSASVAFNDQLADVTFTNEMHLKKPCVLGEI